MKRALSGLLMGCLLLPFVVHAAETEARFPIEQFVISYGRPHADAPSLDALGQTEATLIRSGNVLSATGEGESIKIRLSDPLPAGTLISESAMQTLLAATVRTVNAGGIYGVVAFPSRDQIDPQTKEDLRPAGDKTLKVVLWLSEVAEVRTVGKGSRLHGEAVVSNPVHANIASHSPLVGPADGNSGSLIFKDRLDLYLQNLNRHGGRVVEASLSSTDEPGKVVLDFLINEERPWFVYGQVSNTGTESTDTLRERVGFVHNQLFSRDDVLSVDLLTSNFDTANAAFLSYSFPLIYPDKLRARAYGSWGNFDATAELPDASGESVNLTGDSWTAGAELTWNPLSLWGAAIDLTAGVSSQSYQVRDEAFASREGKADLLVGYVEARAERATEAFFFTGGIGFEGQFADIEPAELLKLGRSDTTDNYNLIRVDAQASTYLDALFRGREDKARRAHTPLAHEIWGQFRGQWIMGGDRVMPQKEQALGGFFTVRGYPESAVSGDNAWVTNLEYRFHLPRVLRPASREPQERGPVAEEPSRLFGRPFNFRPPRVAARPDWDLIIRTFVDYGKTELNLGSRTTPRREDLGHDFTLMSAGVGVELQLQRNLNIRCDVGYVLEDVFTGFGDPNSGDPDDYDEGLNDTLSGDTAFHFLVTLLW